MEFLKLQFLAIIQGLTEFLPVSSSGHLALFKILFGLEEPGNAGPLLEVLLHAGTLISVLFFYRQRIWELLRGLIQRDRTAWRYALTILLSCIPAGLLYVFAGDQLEKAFSNPKVICALLMLTGLILFSLRWQPKQLSSGKAPNFLQALLIGCAQAFAMLPGVSRSGSTYTAGTWLGVGSSEAFDFSFLMSLPVIGGAVLLKLRHFKELSSDGQGFGMFAALIISAVVGYFALKFLARMRIAGKFWWFGIYCLAIGALGQVILLLK